MKSNLTKVIVLNALLLTALTGSLQASLSPITGTIAFTGTATADTSSFSTATKFTLFQDVSVGAPSALSGDYAGTAGTATLITPFTWDPANASTPVTPLWSFEVGTTTYSFVLQSLHKNYASDTDLVLSGVGIASITGPGIEKSDTAALWSFTTQTFNQSTFTYSSSVTAISAVPEPSTYVAGGLMMLPFGLSGIRFLRNRKSAC